MLFIIFTKLLNKIKNQFIIFEETNKQQTL